MLTYRPPAVPLIAHDPYFSVWSTTNHLADSWPKHWTGKTMALAGFAKANGKVYRFCGSPTQAAEVMNQVSLKVEATTTSYEFEKDGVALKVEFWSPTLPNDLELLSKPVSFIRVTNQSPAGTGPVEVYFDLSAEWCVNETSQQVTWGRVKIGDRYAMRIGTHEQPILKKRGDDLRIDWGHLVVLPPATAKTAIGAHNTCRDGFVSGTGLPAEDDFEMPRAANDRWPVLATSVSIAAGKTETITVAYDDRESLEWLRRPVRAYWTKSRIGFGEMLAAMDRDSNSLYAQATQFDQQIRTKVAAVAGSEFADVTSLAYRQAFAAHKIVADIDDKPMMFSKENFSNGCIGTVDVLYPAAPVMLALNPELLEANLRPLLIYSSLPRWKFPFAPHDLGTYPHANGQVYGGGERTEDDQMPVEECGNMLILCAALIYHGGSKEFIRPYVGVLDQWANYLVEKGIDPENQLCTDDFAGHMAHNVNLSLKAIVGLGAYAEMLQALGGHDSRAAELRAKAKSLAADWLSRAGSPSKLAFDQAGTWSQKYNLVWDRALNLNLFPDSFYQAEVESYLPRINRFGLPLDSRKQYTKLDWCVWTACLTSKESDFRAMLDPLVRYSWETPTRVPLSDWYETEDGRMVGFQARSVVGGLFMPLIMPENWRKGVSK